MDFLFLSMFDPRANRGGGAQYTDSIIKMLEAPPLGARVTHLFPKRRNRGLKGAIHGLLRGYAVALSVAFSSLPANQVYVRSRAFRSKIRKRLAEKTYDAVILNTGLMLWMLDELPCDIPKILIAHNIEHELFRSEFDRRRGLPKIARRLLAGQYEKLKRMELEGLKRVDDVVAISSAEADFLRSLKAEADICWVPPTFAYEPRPRRRRGNGDGPLDLMFLANFDWWPNREGVTWFIDKVLAGLGADVRLHLVGKGSETLAPRDSRIVAHGFIEKIEDAWTVGDLMICPAFAGFGVNVKMAEAIYNRVPVVATPLAARGLNLPECPQVVLLDGADAWTAFLGSARARQLAADDVPKDLASRFARGRYVAPLQRFIRDAVERQRPRGAGPARDLAAIT